MIEEKSLIARIRGEHGYLRGRRGELANNIVISDISVSHSRSNWKSSDIKKRQETCLEEWKSFVSII